MNWRKKLRIFEVIAALVLAGCGVKGDPLPPLTPAELGRGRPTYHRAAEEIKIEKNQTGKDDKQKTDKEDDEDEQ